MCDVCTLRTLYSYTNMLGTLINIAEAWTHSLSSTEKKFACDRKRDRQTICSCIFAAHTNQQQWHFFEEMFEFGFWVEVDAGHRTWFDTNQSSMYNFSFPMNLSEQFSAKSIAAHFYHSFMVQTEKCVSNYGTKLYRKYLVTEREEKISEKPTTTAVDRHLMSVWHAVARPGRQRQKQFEQICVLQNSELSTWMYFLMAVSNRISA